MKRSICLIVLGALLVTLTAGPLMAGPSMAEMFKAMDKNSDGKVTVAEFMAACKQDKEKCSGDFSWYDRNRDGALTLPEFEGKVKN
jgi:Ca2+-binding EF-hand superfamily protein